MGFGSSRKSWPTRRKRPARSVTSIRPSGKKATDQGYSSPFNKVTTRNVCFSELITAERSCAKADVKSAMLSITLRRAREIGIFMIQINATASSLS